MDEHGHFPTYRNPIPFGKLFPTAMKEIDPPADATTVHVDFQLRTGPAVRIRVVDATGTPVAGVRTRGASGRGNYERDPMAGAEGEVRNLMPGEERTVLLFDDGHKRGKAIRVRQGDDAAGPVVVALEPLATLAGRVLDPADSPVPGALIHTIPLPSGDFSLRLPQVKTDEQGRFIVPDVAVGCDYQIHAEFGALLKDRRLSSFEKVAVKPGATTEFGDLRIKGD